MYANTSPSRTKRPANEARLVEGEGGAEKGLSLAVEFGCANGAYAYGEEGNRGDVEGSDAVFSPVDSDAHGTDRPRASPDQHTYCNEYVGPLTEGLNTENFSDGTSTPNPVLSRGLLPKAENGPPMMRSRNGGGETGRSGRRRGASPNRRGGKKDRGAREPEDNREEMWTWEEYLALREPKGGAVRPGGAGGPGPGSGSGGPGGPGEGNRQYGARVSARSFRSVGSQPVSIVVMLLRS